MPNWRIPPTRRLASEFGGKAGLLWSDHERLIAKHDDRRRSPMQIGVAYRLAAQDEYRESQVTCAIEGSVARGLNSG
jgi:hypothetical protein